MSVSPSSPAPSSSALLEVLCAVDVFPGDPSAPLAVSLSLAAFLDAARFSDVISSNSVVGIR